MKAGEQYETIIRKALQEMASVEAPVGEYQDALRDLIADARIYLDASIESDVT